MTYTIGNLGPRRFFKPGFDVSLYFVLGARIFSTQRPPYVGHVLQGLQTKPVCFALCMVSGIKYPQ